MTPGLTTGSTRRVWGLMYRHLALYRHSWPRLLELMYWPVLQMCIWGFTASYLVGRGGNVALTAGALLGGVLLWEVALRSQMGVAISFLEELWSRNLGHVFVSPIRPWEMLAALVGISVLRMLTGVLPAIGIAFLLYAFNLFSMGPIVVLFFANLMVMGWWVALGVVSLILRHGAGAEALAWSVLFGLTPFSAVFYPVSVLPAAVQPIALALPTRMDRKLVVKLTLQPIGQRHNIASQDSEVITKTGRDRWCNVVVFDPLDRDGLVPSLELLP